MGLHKTFNTNSVLTWSRTVDLLVMKIQLFFLVCFTAGAFSLYTVEEFDEPTAAPKTIAPWMQVVRNLANIINKSDCQTDKHITEWVETTVTCLENFTKCQADAHSLKELQVCNRAFYKCKFGKCKKICRWEEIKCHAKAKTKEEFLECKAAVAPCLRKNGC